MAAAHAIAHKSSVVITWLATTWSVIPFVDYGWRFGLDGNKHTPSRWLRRRAAVYMLFGSLHIDNKFPNLISMIARPMYY